MFQGTPTSHSFQHPSSVSALRADPPSPTRGEGRSAAPASRPMRGGGDLDNWAVFNPGFENPANYRQDAIQNT
ncbi:MAG: hypothetical protein EOS18_06705 [Mesorhizobium sp.]|nr:MAG: hypothetical protein EOS18_06705 [Mesorhizobium sp.]